MTISIRTDIRTALSLTNSKTLKGDLLKAKIQTQIYYLEEIIQEHFNYPSPNSKYGYKPNSSKYEIWKKKHGKSINQLVSSGRLMELVLAGKVDSRTGGITFNIPEYGLYQLKAGRDFISPSAEDEIVLQDILRKRLFQIRSTRIKMALRK